MIYIGFSLASTHGMISAKLEGGRLCVIWLPDQHPAPSIGHSLFIERRSSLRAKVPTLEPGGRARTSKGLMVVPEIPKLH